MKWPLPYAIASGYYVEFRMPVSITAPYAGAEKTVTQLLVRIKGMREVGNPAPIGFTHYFDTADGLLREKWRKVKYILSGARLVGKEGGTLSCWFYSLSQSTGPTLLVSEYHLADRWGTHAEGVTIEP
jgi:hypothetical protein